MFNAQPTGTDISRRNYYRFQIKSAISPSHKKWHHVNQSHYWLYNSKLLAGSPKDAKFWSVVWSGPHLKPGPLALVASSQPTEHRAVRVYGPWVLLESADLTPHPSQPSVTCQTTIESQPSVTCQITIESQPSGYMPNHHIESQPSGYVPNHHRVSAICYMPNHNRVSAIRLHAKSPQRVSAICYMPNHHRVSAICYMPNHHRVSAIRLHAKSP